MQSYYTILYIWIISTSNNEQNKGVNSKKDQPKLSFSSGGEKGQKLTSSQPIQLDTSNYSNSSMTSVDDPGLN